MMSHTTDILEHLETGQSITAIEALNQFGCFRLAARINELRSQGHLIRTDRVCEQGKEFAKYTLECSHA